MKPLQVSVAEGYFPPALATSPNDNHKLCIKYFTYTLYKHVLPITIGGQILQKTACHTCQIL